MVGAALFAAFGVLSAVLLVREVRDGPPNGAVTLHAVALGTLYLMPAVLAILGVGRGRRRGLLAAAAVMGFALVPTSLSFTPLLIVPSVLSLISYVRLGSGPHPRLAVGLAALAAFLVAAGCAGLLIFGGARTRCYTYIQEPGGQRIYHAAPVNPQRGINSVLAGPSAPAGGSSGSGCNQDLTPPARSLAALALLAAFLGAAIWASSPAAETAPSEAYSPAAG